MRPLPMAVCGISEISITVDAFEPTHILSVLHPEDCLKLPSCVQQQDRLRVNIDDTLFQEDDLAPSLAHVAKIDGWVENFGDGSRLLIHCMAGISRSTAVCLGLLAKNIEPRKAADQLRQLRPEAMPNALIVALWDEYLRLDGELIAAAAMFPFYKIEISDPAD